MVSSQSFFPQSMRYDEFLAIVRDKRMDHKEESGTHQLVVRNKWKITPSLIGFRG